MQQIVITDAKTVKVGETKEIISFSDKEIRLLLASEKRLLIEGSGLKIGNFTKSNGEFSAEGVVVSVRYADKKENPFKKVFK